MQPARKNWLGAGEIAVIGGYGALALHFGSRVLGEVIGYGRPDAVLGVGNRFIAELFIKYGRYDPMVPAAFAAILAAIGVLALLSMRFRALDSIVYLVALLHAAIAVFVTPLWIRMWLMVGAESPVPVPLIPVNLLLPIAVAYLLASCEPRGTRLRQLLAFRPRLTLIESTLLAIGFVAAFGLVYIGGRVGQLLFAVYVVGPLIGVALLVGFILDRIRARRAPDIPNVARRIKLQSGQNKPPHQPHQWTVSAPPRSVNDD